MIQKVTEAKQIDDHFLFEEYPVEEQKKFMDHLLQYLHFDPQWGYQNETEHPFTSWTCENDCRTTTKYLLNNLPSAILSTVHEVGHATYEHDIDPKYDGMILSNGATDKRKMEKISADLNPPLCISLDYPAKWIKYGSLRRLWIFV